MKNRWLAVACSALVCFAPMVSATSASAAVPLPQAEQKVGRQPVQNGAYTFRNVATGSFLSAPGTGPGGLGSLASTGSGTDQAIQIATQADGTVQLRSVTSGACLTPQPNSTLATQACGQASQGFVASRQRGGTVFTQKVSGLILAATGDSLVMAPAGHTNNLAWQLVPSAVNRVAVNARAHTDGGPSFAANTTIRMTAPATASGTGVRVTLNNQFGLEALSIDAVTVAIEGSSGSAIAVPVPVTFSGSRAVSIPTGQEMASDASTLSAAAGQTILVTVHLAQAVSKATVHPMAVATTYIAEGSDQTMAVDSAAFTQTTTSTFFLRSVDLASTTTHKTVAIIGDSITDGYASPVDGNLRWPDQLSARLRAHGEPVAAVVNLGISANKVTYDRYPSAGPAAVKRFNLDVIQQAGVTDVIIYEGINDVDDGETFAEISGGITELVRQARAAGLKVHVATLPPFKGWAGEGPGEEEVRVQLNEWIRANSVKADSVQDFAAILRDPVVTNVLNPAYDVGDHLHPNVDGFAAIVAGLNYQSLNL